MNVSTKSVFCLFAGLILSGLLVLPAEILAANEDEDIVQVQNVNPKRLLKTAQKEMRRGNYTEAEKAIRLILRNNPEHVRARLDLANLHLKRKRIVDAYELALPIAQADDKNSFAYAIIGMTLLHSGRFQDAEKIFYAALAMNRKEALAWAGLGQLDFYENRISDSIDKMAEAVYLDNRDPDFIFSYAQISARGEKYKEAGEAYERFLAISADTDVERRERIKGLIRFLRFLGERTSLYETEGSESNVKFDLINNRPVIDVYVNGKDRPLKFVLDTGSGISVISNETAELLGTDAVARGGTAKGIGGDGKFEIVYGFLRNIRIGDVKINNVPIYIREFHHNSVKIDGYIGLSLISKFLTTIDYGDKTFRLAKKDAEQQGRFFDDTITMPLRLTSSGFLSGSVTMPGFETPMNFIVDTGASVSVISSTLAKNEELDKFLDNDTLRVVGAAGVTDNVRKYNLPSISFGEHSRDDISAIALDLGLINEAAGFNQEGILGGNFLKNYRMTFDFKNSKVIVTPLEKKE